MKLKMVVYWVSTVYVAFALFTSGVVEVLDAAGWHVWGNYAPLVAFLGYPTYFLAMVGPWKILGAIAILVPGFPRVKEWAYAGIFFFFSGAVISWSAVSLSGTSIPAIFGSNLFQPLFIDLHLLILNMVSWALRQRSRTLGTLF